MLNFKELYAIFQTRKIINNCNQACTNQSSRFELNSQGPRFKDQPRLLVQPSQCLGLSQLHVKGPNQPCDNGSGLGQEKSGDRQPVVSMLPPVQKTHRVQGEGVMTYLAPMQFLTPVEKG
jgi:hypothetical protein